MKLSCLASVSLSAKQGHSSPEGVAASIQMLLCGRLSILGYLSALVWRWDRPQSAGDLQGRAADK